MMDVAYECIRMHIKLTSETKSAEKRGCAVVRLSNIELQKQMSWIGKESCTSLKENCLKAFLVFLVSLCA